MGRTARLGADLCKAYYGLVIVAGLLYAYITNPLGFAYDLSMVWVPGALVFSAQMLLLIGRRRMLARTIVVPATLALDAVALIDLFVFGAFDVLSGRMGTPFASIMLALFLIGSLASAAWACLARSARSYLSEALNADPVATEGNSWETPLRERVRTRVFWRDIAIYFTSFSFFGHWAEMLFCYGIYLGIFMGKYDFSEVMLWHQWLFPYLAEAVAMVLVVVLLHPFKQWLFERFNKKVLPTLLVSMAVTAVVCVSIDFIAGMICNRDYRVWDYRDMPFNFMGQVCLQNSVVYTLAATGLVWIVYPALDGRLRRMGKDKADLLCISLITFFAFCALLHFVYVQQSGALALGMVMRPEG